jgi:hypothetical protein
MKIWRFLASFTRFSLKLSPYKSLRDYTGQAPNAAKRQIFWGLSFSPPAGGEKIVRANLRIVHKK